ncbi:MAG: hypothetical protein M3Y87_29610 [Myxococcota bacterium]|nr:hypothetical protein [Myxococcota bacterium]
MSDDELLVFLVCLGAAAFFAWRALGPVLMVSPLHATPGTRYVVLGVWVVGIALVHSTLISIAAQDVRESVTYTAFYDVMGLAWIGASVAVLRRLDLSLRDDVIERRNPAALAAISGAIVGIALAYAGGNVGDGPGWWCVVIASGVATAALFAVWITLYVAARSGEAITIDRDLPAGIRVGALLAACGLVFGRGAAGDWVSASDTIASFALVAWPAVILVLLGIFVERALAPRGQPSRGGLGLAIGVAVVYLGAAATVVHGQGIPA